MSPSPLNLASPLNALGQAYQYAVAQLASLMRPRAESPAEAASRLRVWADGFYMNQPSYAADLRAAADRADRQMDGND
ncbi:MAG: hypothetical protein H7143_07150 [Pseudorhodobacter sp.]|nr:hypothetical protein [Rhizobacter sp.]